MSVYHFKILVPAAAAGRIIGKGGTTIAQLQRDAGARVKMSKASEFYPGTTERVCLISGPIEGILKINDFFMENFSSTSMKILVPNSTAGMIIGKCGSYIKQIKEESGAYVQISQKCTDLSLPERCVTIVGELDNIRRACAMILSKIVEDSATTTSNHYRDIRASSLTNGIISPSLTFAAVTPPVSTTTPTLASSTSPPSTTVAAVLTSTPTNTTTAPNCSSNTNSSLASSRSSTSSTSPIQSTVNHHSNSHSHLLCPPPAASSATLPHLSLAAAAAAAVSAAATTTSSTTAAAIANLMPHIRAPTSVSPMVVPKSHSVASEMNSDQIIESIKLVLRVSGYGEDAVSEITSAMSTLASYGVLGVGLGLL